MSSPGPHYRRPLRQYFHISEDGGRRIDIYGNQSGLVLGNGIDHITDGRRIKRTRLVEQLQIISVIDFHQYYIMRGHFLSQEEKPIECTCFEASEPPIVIEN